MSGDPLPTGCVPWRGFHNERGYKVVIPAGTLKGISEADARRIAREHHGEVYRSTVTLYADGSELLGSWERVSG
jgi:hypothetical protein